VTFRVARSRPGSEAITRALERERLAAQEVAVRARQIQPREALDEQELALRVELQPDGFLGPVQFEVDDAHLQSEELEHPAEPARRDRIQLDMLRRDLQGVELSPLTS
jgi:hypothetical protein